MSNKNNFSVDNLYSTSHRRYNILTDEWVLVSPDRTQRPWLGKKEQSTLLSRLSYDPKCYLCPNNMRVNGEINPNYTDTYVFDNDVPALLKEEVNSFKDGLLTAEPELGICRVVCFSPEHSLTLSLMEYEEIVKVIKMWRQQYSELGGLKGINYVQIFENKGEIMGCSNPHPHGQIWGQKSIPNEILKKNKTQQKYWQENGRSLLGDYLKQELNLKERILFENDHFVTLAPYWAIWPYEMMILPKVHFQNITQLNKDQVFCFADMIKKLTVCYDNLFKISFPYSSGIHQAPTNLEDNQFWHFHMSFYPPLLRSAKIKKFMVGYEMFACPQRDITIEQAVRTLKKLPAKHYSK